MPTYVIALYLISSTTLLSLAGLVLRKNGKSIVNRTVCAFSLAAVFWMLSLYLGFYWATTETVATSNLFFRLCFGFGFLMPFCLPVFFYYFIKKTFVFPSVLKVIFMCLGLFMFYIAAFTPFVYESVVVLTDRLELGDILGPYYLPFIISFVFIFLIALVIALVKMKHIKNPIERKKLAIATWGSVFFMFITSVTNLILPFFGIIIFQLESGAFSLFFTIPAFYSIARYRFLDINLTIQRALSYATNTIAYALPLSWAFIAFESTPILLVSWAIGIIVLAVSFWNTSFFFFERVTSYLFFCETTNPLQKIRRSLSSFKKSIQAGLDSLASSLQVSGAQFVFAQDPNGPLAPKELNDLVHFFDSNDSGLVSQELEYKISEETDTEKRSSLKSVNNTLKKYMLSAAIPVLDDNKKLLGILLLEKTLEKRLFSVQEMKAVKRLMHDASVYLCQERDHHLLTRRLHDSSQVKAEFLNGIMHEINHPLMLARNLSDMIEWQKLKPEDQKFIKNSEQGLQDLSQKLDGISQAFQWQNGLIDLEKSYLQVPEFFTLVFADFPDHLIDLDIGKTLNDTLVQIDVHNLKIAFVELLKNSFFFNKSTTPIVSITVRKDKKNIVCTVTDNGIGIKKENWENVFQVLFVEAFSRNRKECGIGVGLAKVKGIVEAHDGECTVKSSSKKGTSIEIRLPVVTKY